MREQFSRTEMLLGSDAVEKLAGAKVAVFGVGGVGSYACEALARAGVGAFVLVDGDTVSESNINRQIIATHDTVGQVKVEVMRRRILAINPEADVCAKRLFYSRETENEVSLDGCTCVLDAIDTVESKLMLIIRAQAQSIPVISCMGAGNKLDPSQFRADDIYSTSVCPLARVMRSRLRKLGVERLRVVYSREAPVKPAGGGSLPGSVSYCAPAAGLVCASEIVRIITE